MRIGHSGHTRPLERIVCWVLLVIAMRIAVPLPSAVYTNYLAKAVFAVLVGAPAVWLLLSRSLLGRKRALLAVLLTYAYCGLLAVAADWTRFGSATAFFGLAGVSAYLYFVTAREVEWTRAGSSPSPPPADPPSRT